MPSHLVRIPKLSQLPISPEKASISQQKLRVIWGLSFFLKVVEVALKMHNHTCTLAPGIAFPALCNPWRGAEGMHQILNLRENPLRLHAVKGPFHMWKLLPRKYCLRDTDRTAGLGMSPVRTAAPMRSGC